VNVYPRGERDEMTTKGRGLNTYVGKRKLYVPDFFQRPPQKKPLWAPEKMVRLHTPEKGMLYVPEKVVQCLQCIFPSMRSKKNWQKTVKGLDFLTL